MAKFAVGQRVIITHADYPNQHGVIVDVVKRHGRTWYMVVRDAFPDPNVTAGFMAKDLRHEG